MKLPHASEILPLIRLRREAAAHLFVGLDFDGTLTPIVPRPADAHLPPRTCTVLARLAARTDTVLAVLSGRALADVRGRVGVPGVYYSGNHGLEIEGPGLSRAHPGGAAVSAGLERLRDELQSVLADVPGVIVEDKGASLSVHYRMVPAELQGEVRALARRLGQGAAGVRVMEGKRVVELRPDVDWHKGAALQSIRAALPLGAAGPALFIGDDRTDEDAFRAVAPTGWGIVVAGIAPAVTAATAWLRSPEEVVDWLEELVR